MGKVRVMLDTNVVLDFFTDRMGDGVAGKIVQIGRTSQFEMCISFLTAVNVMYVIRKTGVPLSPADLPDYFTILSQEKEQWDDAQTLMLPDFEDSLQAACALRNNCYIVISRDRHFSSAPMSVLSPEDFLNAVLQPR